MTCIAATGSGYRCTQQSTEYMSVPSCETGIGELVVDGRWTADRWTGREAKKNELN